MTAAPFKENMNSKTIIRNLQVFCPDYELDIKDSYPSGCAGWVTNTRTGRKAFLQTGIRLCSREILVKPEDGNPIFPRSWRALQTDLERLLD